MRRCLRPCNFRDDLANEGIAKGVRALLTATAPRESVDVIAEVSSGLGDRMPDLDARSMTDEQRPGSRSVPVANARFPPRLWVRAQP